MDDRQWEAKSCFLYAYTRAICCNEQWFEVVFDEHVSNDVKTTVQAQMSTGGIFS
jgi:hypothetical protein